MKIEPIATPEYPGFQFVVTAESGAEKVLIAHIQEVLQEGNVRPVIHGITWNCGNGYTSFNFGFLREEHFKAPEKPKPKRKKKGP